MPGLIGRKIGMTRRFTEAGVAVPVTVVEAPPCRVLQVKTVETDGYRAVQIGWGAKKDKRATRAELGHAAKAGLEHAPRMIREFPTDGDSYEPGQELTVAFFREGERVRITGLTKGRGFQGVVKRHGFSGRPASHGHPMSRNPGSMGPGTDPSRVIKGKKLPGRMGGNRKTISRARIVAIDEDRNLLLVQGALPGSRNSRLLIRR